MVITQTVQAGNQATQQILQATLASLGGVVMTWYEFLSLTLSALGFIGVVISVGILIRQTKHVEQSLASSTYNNVSSHIMKVGEVFVSYPDLRPYFYEGMDITEQEEGYQRVVAIALLMLDFFDSFLVQAKYYNQYSPGLQELWHRYITDIFARSPVLRKVLASHKNWYEAKMMELMIASETKNSQQLHPRSQG